MSITITGIYKIGGLETLITGKVDYNHKVKIGQIYQGRTGPVIISHVHETHSQGAYPGLASFNVNGNQSRQDFRVKDVLNILTDNEPQDSDFDITEPVVVELLDPIALIRSQRDQVLRDFYENLKSKDAEHADKWILETNYCAEEEGIWPQWEIARQLPDMLDHVFRQLSYLYSLANWKAYFDNLGHKLPFLVTINYDFKLLTEDQKHSVYNTIKGIVKLQFTRQELELLWIQCGQPYVAEQYHRYLDRIWELYHHRLQNTDSSTQFGFLRSPFSRYRQSFEDSYGDKYCSELEGHIIVLQIDPLTLKPKIIDPIVLGPEDETLNVFLMPRGMGLLASKKSERNDC